MEKILDARDQICRTIYADQELVHNLRQRGDMKYGLKNADTWRMLKDHAVTEISRTARAEMEKPNDENCNNVEYTFMYRVPECSEGDDVEYDFDCTDTDAASASYEKERLTVPHRASHRFTIDFGKFCHNNKVMSEEARMIMMDNCDIMLAKVNKKAAEVLSGLPGAYAGGEQSSLVDIKTLPLFYQNSDGKVMPQPESLALLREDFQRQAPRSYMNDEISITGSRYMNMLQLNRELYRGNMEGHDITKIEGFNNMYYDPIWKDIYSDTIGSSNVMFSFLKDYVHLLEFYRFDNPNRRKIGNTDLTSYMPQFKVSNPSLVRQRLDITPYTSLATGSAPFEVDFQVYLPQTCAMDDKLVITMVKYFNVIGIPPAAFCDNSNRITVYDLACGQPLACNDFDC